jgi:hypothetical protein
MLASRLHCNWFYLAETLFAACVNLALARHFGMVVVDDNR